MKGIHRELTYPHSPERVWEALTDPRIMRLWLMEAEDFEPRVGCRFRFRTKPAPGFDGTIHCEVLEVDPQRRLVYSWRSGKAERATTVSWVLYSVPSGTRLVFDHSGFAGVGGLFLRTVLGRGWGHKLRDYMPLLLTRLGERSGDVEGIDRTGLLECEAE